MTSLLLYSICLLLHCTSLRYGQYLLIANNLVGLFEDSPSRKPIQPFPKKAPFPMSLELEEIRNSSSLSTSHAVTYKRSWSLFSCRNPRNVYQAARRRALIHRALVSILLLTAFCITAGIIYLSLVIVVIRLNTPIIPNNGLQHIVRAWNSPGDSLRLIEPNLPHFSDDLVPVPCHSHNDYTRRTPLFQALAARCISIEADIYLPSREYVKSHSLRDGDLHVGHSRSSLRPDRTLRALYTDPLLHTLTSINDATTTELSGIFSTDPAQSLTLLLDFKEKSPTALSGLWDRMQAHLAPFRVLNASYLTSSLQDNFFFRPLTVVVTGAAPFDFVLDSTKNAYKDVFFDAPLHDLYPQADVPSPYNSSNSYLASTSLKQHIGNPSLWSGHFSASQVGKMQRQIQDAKELGLISRYWGTPGWPVSVRGYVWSTLWELGVGLLSVDDVEVAGRWDWERGAKPLGWCWLLRGWVGRPCP